MHFPPGGAILLIVLFLLAGIVGVFTGAESQPPGELVLWTFDPTHRLTYDEPAGTQPALTELHQQQTGHSVDIQLMPSRALDARLLSVLLAMAGGDAVPDLVEIEIGSVGKYLRPAAGDSGLLPLNGFLSDADVNLSPARLATWTLNGQVLGIPRDVHPVTITYRHDLFSEAGIELAKCETWDEFRDACIRYQQFQRGKGREISAMQLARWSTAELMVMLHQQRIQLIDLAGRPQLASQPVADTVAFYAQLVSGPDAIAEQVSAGATAQSLGDGDTAALMTPDWRVDHLRWDPDLLGKLRMMPLPRFSAADARTASWGGTVIAIPRNARDPRASWELLRNLHLTPEALRARAYHSDVIPAVTSAWVDPGWDRPNPVYAYQPIGALYAQLARELPEQRVSAYSLLMSQSLAGVLAAAQAHLELSGPEQLPDFCLERLQDAQKQLDQLIDFAEETR